MKVSFITKHSVSNYGSILQTYATQEVIKKLGCEPEIINYMRYDLRNNKLYNTLLKNQPKWNKNILTRLIYKIIQMPNYILMDRKFRKFREKMYDNTTILYGSNEELKKTPPKADVYCTGSDQIWGKNVNGKLDKAYFLDFVPEGSKCISYAASIGLDKVSSEFEKNIGKLLSKYQEITVREESAVDILKRNGIESKLVLDPTLLLEKEEWAKIIDKKKTKKKYILIYQLHSNKKFEEYARAFSKKVGLPLIRVTPSINQITRCGKFVYLPTPSKFLYYFKNASYVITDSFHGTVFSIIFNRNFIDISPGDTATRIKNILKMVNLDERLLKDYNDFSLIDKEIEWDNVNEILKQEKDRSIKIFKQAILKKNELKNVGEMNKNRCTGCRACEQLCPTKAISMNINKEGFIEPHVDKNKCINCRKCVIQCPQLKEKTEIKNESNVYAVKLRNSSEQIESSSGGAFVAIAKVILNLGGIVYGCAFSDDLKAIHIRIENEKELIKLKGSKYVQSDTNYTYIEVKKDLENNKIVLYSGTPCQIGGLNAYLGKEYKNLITVDFVCHGVPSPKLFEKYKQWIEKRNNGKLTFYNFRDKEKNLWGLNSKLVLEKNNKIVKIYQRASLDPYYKSFLKGYTYRECCYNCRYANKNRVSDFTIADYWGIEKEHPDFYDKKGVSILIVNTNKAQELFNKVKEYIEFIESTMEKASRKNVNLNRPFFRPKQRDYAYIGIDDMEFEKYSKKSLNFKKDLKDIISSKIPNKVKQKLKKA